MAAISFTAEEVLPALLNKRKTQTIRPIGKRLHQKGDIVTLYWRQRSINGTFCKKCYKAVPMGRYNGKCFHCGNTEFFNKKLGRVMITDVFKIEVIKEVRKLYGTLTMWRIRGIDSRTDYWGYWNSGQIEDLAEQDGFKDSNQMFKWLNENHNITDSKKFVVYRWDWV